MSRIYCNIVIGLLIACLIGPVQRADASKEKMYVSSRVKIVRSANSGAGAGGSATGTQDAEKNLVPAATSQTGDTRVETPDVSTPTVVSDQISEAAIKSEFASLLGSKERFYSRKGRIDPFEPFLHEPEPEASTDMQAELNRRVPRTPLEKIDLIQLKLTGILRAQGKTRALVQEVSGKGYIIDEGTYIGNKGGQVSKILKDRIMVSEKALDVFGKITVLERELKLQQ